MKFQCRLPLYTLVLAVFLAGCAPTTGIQQQITQTQETTEAKIKQLLNDAAQAEPANPATASQLRAQAIDLLQQTTQTEQIPALLQQLDTTLLPADTRLRFTLLKAKTAFEQQQYLQVISTTERLISDQTFALQPEDRITLLTLKAEAESASSQPFPALRTLIDVSLLQDSEARIVTHDLIWSKLSRLDTTLISTQLRSGTNTYYEQGWLELINELNNNTQLDTQSQALSNWQTLWQSHPAYNLPPSALQGLDSGTLQAKKIAILLPFEGKLAKAADAIKTGILMAHYRSQNGNQSAPELLFLDSTLINTPSALEAITQQQAVDLVIGPLTKEYVADLINNPSLSTPVLALNYADMASREGVVQFGLSAENEAQQIAERIWQDGHRRVAVLTPDNSWGTQVSKEFIQHFAELGGHAHSQVLFGSTEQFSEDVARLLNTDASKQRYKRIRQVLYTKKIEFEEHRRTDIDAIVLAALPNDARQLAPILAFNFAGDLPIYATSHLYSGSPESVQDQDLNRISFVDMPWNLQNPSQNKVLLTQQRDNTHSRFGRLYALGLDAYRLYPYLKQLAALPNTEIGGETGTLSIDQSGRVYRKLVWAQFKEGVPQLLEPTSTNTSTSATESPQE